MCFSLLNTWRKRWRLVAGFFGFIIFDSVEHHLQFGSTPACFVLCLLGPTAYSFETLIGLAVMPSLPGSCESLLAAAVRPVDVAIVGTWHLRRVGI